MTPAWCSSARFCQSSRRSSQDRSHRCSRRCWWPCESLMSGRKCERGCSRRLPKWRRRLRRWPNESTAFLQKKKSFWHVQLGKFDCPTLTGLKILRNLPKLKMSPNQMISARSRLSNFKASFLLLMNRKRNKNNQYYTDYFFKVQMIYLNCGKWLQ